MLVVHNVIFRANCHFPIFELYENAQEDFRRENKEAVTGSDPEPICHISAATIVACGSLNHM